MTDLPDVNVLVALADPHHVHHELAHDWFGKVGHLDWATCAITELGFIRVLSNPAYSSTIATPGEASWRLARFCNTGGHVFWPDDLPPRTSLGGEARDRLQGHRQVTDFHLAALAAHHGGRLATFDGRLVRTLRGTRLAAAVALIQ